MNKYPLWKYLLIAVVLLVGVFYALPNLYGDDPAVQVLATRAGKVDGATLGRLEQALKAQGIELKRAELAGDTLLLRFTGTEPQLKAYELVRETLGGNYAVALNLAPATPGWLRAIDALPMYLGLDLRGGVHFLMQVDMDAAAAQALERYVSDWRTLLRENKLRYLTVATNAGQVEARFRSAEERDQAQELLHKEYRDLLLDATEREGTFLVQAGLSEQELREIKKFALQQNITTLRNRVNELGVAEPVIQQQGDERIVVQLPGVQDTARAKDILGATATLEYHLVDEERSVEEAVAGRVPPMSRLYRDRQGQPILLLRQVIITGDQIINAASGIDSQSGGPMVSVTLDGQGARRMDNTTRDNVGKRMAVVFVESKTETKLVNGEPQRSTSRSEEVISVAVIRDRFSKRFQTTGLDSPEEARNLALLLRAGALAAPMEIIEERTIGPSLGQDNINQGVASVLIGFALVVGFMVFWYRAFGLVANVALLLNLVLIVAVLSLLQATLTLPGIAGIVLTLGMAVDANVLIFERIREELGNGNSPQASINAGYERAFATIADANITTLIAAVVLFGFGTGPIKGFAVTLSIGILTSMFTAVMVSRAVVNLTYGRQRRLTKLPLA
ncbi:MAG: protein translocase subunit SecD [Gammaproteobacteria bacterium HGW-Gammaproteobacteria-1]|jgi:preprotein translocase subunit SecD|nr:MAG: protein translocase subunit SecD [Gammaproteobacteria bacterium HGW-Gammaproteobacteria-1]